jgi:hypothetical protein
MQYSEINDKRLVDGIPRLVRVPYKLCLDFVVFGRCDTQ